MTGADAPAVPPGTIPRAYAALVNVLAFLVVQIVRDDRWQPMLADLRDVLDACSPTASPLFRELVQAGRAVLAAEPASLTPIGGAIWLREMLAAEGALANFFYWRATVAAEPFRKLAQGGAADGGV